MTVSAAHGRASNKYNKAHYDRILLLLPKGRKAELQEIATKQSKSLNRYIIDAIDAYENDNHAPT